MCLSAFAADSNTDAPFIETVPIPDKDYSIGKYEVTQAQYESVTGKNPSWFKGDKQKLPVENVSWDDAVEFCRLLTLRERRSNRIAHDMEYRLPTSAEWGYACIAGTRTRYNTGESFKDLESAGWYKGNAKGMTHHVGEKKANPFGIFDMHGNVCEWTSTYPQGQLRNNTVMAVLVRGGSWNNESDRCTNESSFTERAQTASSVIGFRVVLAPVAKSNSER